VKPFKKIILAMMGSIFLFYCSIDPAPTYAAPKLVLKEEVFDFHEVSEGRTLEHDFVILNKGDQPLAIQDVKTG
jgi:hypothetical protein